MGKYSEIVKMPVQADESATGTAPDQRLASKFP
jgi:hypothetical protein